ncbi:MBL fold metallo-hydrolase [Lysinibacillus fusiformis]|uniref:MBL fold metallo-hydrolase n=1 Tax=Lysinibacillus fusiformis TaxID=28031 RepID=UPI00215ABC47|nr:MBL fold metallo-hydrolase [Lysinibacillus fusiformis]MCR8855661.1 MBL fold metallo-hydrolase [Lysinibacillus fusiformis]
MLKVLGVIIINELFSINMFEAGNGDSFFIRCEGKYITNIIIDFGYSNTYKDHIEKYLIAMAANNEKIDLVIITHYDQDHISGGIRFFEDNGSAEKPNIISVSEVWHNSYKHLKIKESDKELTKEEKEYILENSIVVEQNRNIGANDTSAKQGSRLAANLKYYEYNWNSMFENKAIMYRANNSITLNQEVEVIVLSPTPKEIENLEKVWKKELKKKFPTIELNDDEIFDDAVECISLMKRPKSIPSIKDTSTSINLENLAGREFQEDTDEINASSITCIIKFKEKKLLMLGDSVPSTIEVQLKQIYQERDFPIIFDGIKVSHHGSMRNTSSSLLELIDSKNYFISTNGSSHGHPDIETIAKIITRKNNGFVRKIYFSHKFSKLDFLDSEELKQKYNYELHYKVKSEDAVQIYL